MSLRIRYQYITGARLGFSVERLADGLFLDHSSMTFKASPTQTIANMTEGTSPFKGLYRATLGNTPVSVFTNGQYAIGIHGLDNSNLVISLLLSSMIDGDDNSVTGSGSSGGSVDIAAVASGVWNYGTSLLTTSGSVGKLVKDQLDAAISTRSTYNGGPVQSVTDPVVVKTNQDKSGYTLAANGLDAIMIEQGINARQALSPILAATAGVISGVTTGQIVIRGGNSALTRIQATTDRTGNRTAVILNLPS